MLKSPPLWRAFFVSTQEEQSEGPTLSRPSSANSEQGLIQSLTSMCFPPGISAERAGPIPSNVPTWLVFRRPTLKAYLRHDWQCCIGCVPDRPDDMVSPGSLHQLTHHRHSFSLSPSPTHVCNQAFHPRDRIPPNTGTR